MTEPTTLAADPSRWPLRFPLAILAAIALGSILVWLFERRAHYPDHAIAAAAASARTTVLFCGTAFAYLRFIYIPRTRLTLDAAGVALAQPLASWRARWTDIATITETRWYDVTHRGGSSAGLKLRLTNGQTRRIPDVFPTRRKQLAELLGNRQRDSRSAANST